MNFLIHLFVSKPSSSESDVTVRVILSSEAVFETFSPLSFVIGSIRPGVGSSPVPLAGLPASVVNGPVPPDHFPVPVEDVGPEVALVVGDAAGVVLGIDQLPRSMLAVVVPEAGVARAVRPGVGAVALLRVSRPLAVVAFAVGKLVLAVAVLSSLQPVTVVVTPVCPLKFALPVKYVIFEVSDIILSGVPW